MDVANISNNAVNAHLGVSGSGSADSRSNAPKTTSQGTAASKAENVPRLNQVVALDSSTKDAILKVQEGEESFQVPSKMTLEYKKHEASRESS
jgi:hypothetical protein